MCYFISGPVFHFFKKCSECVPADTLVSDTLLAVSKLSSFIFHQADTLQADTYFGFKQVILLIRHWLHTKKGPKVYRLPQKNV